MSDDERVPTVRERAEAAGITGERLALHHERGAVLLDGEVVGDLDQPAPYGTRINFAGQ